MTDEIGPLVAVVNDDTAFLELMEELLSDEGYRTVIHRESDTAYQAIRGAMPALVILDIRMEHPEGGWNVLELLRLDPKTTGIPVIVCSADAIQLRAKQEHLQRHRAVSIEKPFDLDELLELVVSQIGEPRRE
ncbi:MAG TPA: response regulator [Thermomicrobiaceae bacterium]|nr:response regulator [Thermomicrobiaceae bacterium]